MTDVLGQTPGGRTTATADRRQNIDHTGQVILTPPITRRLENPGKTGRPEVLAGFIGQVSKVIGVWRTLAQDGYQRLGTADEFLV